MKKIMKYLLLACFAVLVGACSKVKNERWIKKGAGEWQVKSIALKSGETTLNVEYPFMKFIFDETGTFARIVYSDSEQTIITGEEGGSWSCKKKSILLNYSTGWDEEMEILTLEKDKMELKFHKLSNGSVFTLSLEKAG